MGLDEARDRAERELEHLETAIEVHEADASPDAVLSAYAATANLAGAILFSDAVDRGRRLCGSSRRTCCMTSCPRSAGRSANASGLLGALVSTGRPEAMADRCVSLGRAPGLHGVGLARPVALGD